jgi:isochorismate synthase
VKKPGEYNTLNQIIRQFRPGELFDQVVDTDYPMVLWRMPCQSKLHALIDLNPDFSNSNFDGLEVMPKGFLVNQFADHHPSSPTLLKADIEFEWEAHQSVLHTISPLINDEHLTTFLNSLKKTNPKRSNQASKRVMAEDYQEMVDQAKTEIHYGHFNKVVLSRYEDHHMDGDIKMYDLFLKATEQYPNAFVYLLWIPKTGIWLGATPETLLSIENDRVFRTHSLAGTQKLGAEQSLNSVAWTQKEIEEQAMVSRYIIDCFKKIRLREFEENGPKTIRAGRLAHLKTEYLVDMTAVNMPELGSIMLDLLHPTSAVCGMPLKEALSFISGHEKYDRELYSGFLGLVNFNGFTHLFVNLRCMKVMGDVARVYAGAGITADSDAEMEYRETQMKMQTMLRLIE